MSMSAEDRKKYNELIKGAWQMTIFDCYPELFTDKPEKGRKTYDRKETKPKSKDRVRVRS